MLPPGYFPPFSFQPPQPIYQPTPQPTPPPGRGFVPFPSPSPSPSASPAPSAPATVTISNTNPVVITIHANQFLDFTHSVTMNIAPGVQATGVQASTGAATIQGDQVVWNGFTLNAGDEATASVTLAVTPGQTLSAPGTPSIASVSLSALDANGQPVAQDIPAGGPPVDSLTPSSLAAVWLLSRRRGRPLRG
jgi:hypothetical protein